mgnify:CR=1 FL=1
MILDKIFKVKIFLKQIEPFYVHLPNQNENTVISKMFYLAMENLFESFSMSREISYKNVYKIDELARKHGLKLSSIMGHKSEITDEEIELCKEHALKKRA